MLKKIAYLLTKRDKRILALIFLVILGSAFLDLVGTSSILPVVEILVSPDDVLQTSSFIRLINNLFNLGGDAKNLCFVCLGCMALLFLLKCVYSIFSTYLINKFTLSYSRKLTKKLMTSYLLFPYEFHLDNNSSTLIRKSTYDVEAFTHAITDLLNLVTKMTSITAIVIFLFIQDWKVTLILLALILVFSFVVLKIVKPKSKEYGRQLQKYNSDNYKYLSQAFNGIKESKISNTEPFFINVYDKNRIIINKYYLKKAVLNSVPGHTLELVGMLGICLALSVIILIGTPSSQIVLTFSAFAYAIIKILPSVTGVTTVINNLQFYEVSVKSLYDDIKLTEDNEYFEEDGKNIDGLPFEQEICASNVTFYYNSIPDRLVLNDVSFKIKKNTSVAFYGSSGAGKTTAIDLILGLLPCRAGQITCDGIDISKNLRGWRRNISYIPQNIYLSDDTIRNNIAFGINSNSIDETRIWDAIDKAQLKDYVMSLPDGLDTIIGERGVRMSGGQRQRIGIARAFYRNTNIIVFDEATSALDYETEKSILNHVSKFSKDHTLIIITHRLNTIDTCDSIFKVEDGRVLKTK